MLKAAKLTALRAARCVGGYAALRGSRWRRERLLILCYHGISLSDEHCWNPELYMPGALFEQRLAAIREQGYNALPLDDALNRLYAGELPPQSLCLTFDDGFHDFAAVAYPLLQKYGIPATVYLTSFYSAYRRPVFDLMCSYLLWKARSRTLEVARLRMAGPTVDLAQRGAWQGAAADIRRFANEKGYSADDRDQLLGSLASELGVDYQALVTSRILQIMSAAELADLDPTLVQVELHTHRHRVPLDKALFQREICQNRDYIRIVTPKQKVSAHFCYPSGVTSPVFLPWLRELGICSGTTCRPGLASPADEPLMLPRFLDMCGVSSDEFDGWLSGFASKMPRRRLPQPEPTASGILV
jgi:peptidoglycan/xylan/chitin deacetylase (PgdA/CDA1 family)